MGTFDIPGSSGVTSPDYEKIKMVDEMERKSDNEMQDEENQEGGKSMKGAKKGKGKFFFPPQR
jgi:hypothetical protein